MNATKITVTLEDGSEVVVFPVTPAPEPTPEIPQITVPLNTPIELVAEVLG